MYVVYKMGHAAGQWSVCEMQYGYYESHSRDIKKRSETALDCIHNRSIVLPWHCIGWQPWLRFRIKKSFFFNFINPTGHTLPRMRASQLKMVSGSVALRRRWFLSCRQISLKRIWFEVADWWLCFDRGNSDNSYVRRIALRIPTE